MRFDHLMDEYGAGRGKPIDYPSFEPTDLEEVRSHLIGGGRVGGKAKGFLFAKTLLQWTGFASGKPFAFVFPRTFYVGTDLFDEFISRNGLEECVRELPFEDTAKAFLKAPLPAWFEADLERTLRQVEGPIAIRSSSLLEDSLKFAFAGKYLTQFLAPAGSFSSFLERAKEMVKLALAYTFNPAAAEYRRKHRLKIRHEKMALMIQEVMGKRRGKMFYPELAGVGLSRVARRFSPRIRKEDGMLRMCFGLGTRTTDRCFARNFYLTDPSLRPEGSVAKEIVRHSQESFDYVDLEDGLMKSAGLEEKVEELKFLHRNLGKFVSVYDGYLLHSLSGYFEDSPANRYIFSFEQMPRAFRGFFSFMRETLLFLEEQAGFAVDVEFTYETETGEIGIVQSRPLASYEHLRPVRIPHWAEERAILAGNRMISNGFLPRTDFLVLVDPMGYLSCGDKFRAARAVGEVNRRLEGTSYVLVGPGRWGSSNPELGVPVRYSEISNCGCLVELGLPSSGFSPELSYGTHFFMDLDLDGIIYMPVYVGEEGNLFDRDFFEGSPREEMLGGLVRIYRGPFAVYLDGEEERGVVALVEEVSAPREEGW